MKIRVKNAIDKAKEVKLGFSWSTLFFGALVPLFRLDFKYFAIMVAVNLLLTVMELYTLSPIATLAFAFFYNKLYAKDLYKKGYRGLTKEENNEFIKYVN